MNNKNAILKGAVSVMKRRGQEEKRKKPGNCHGLAVDLISHLVFFLALSFKTVFMHYFDAIQK